MIAGRHVPTGTVVTIDGNTGEVFLGAHHHDKIEVPEVAILGNWVRDPPSTAGTALQDGYCEAATRDTVSRALALKGMGDLSTIAAVLGAKESEVSAIMDELVKSGEVEAMPKNRVRPSQELSDRVDDWYAEAAKRLKAKIEPQMNALHAVNDTFKGVVTDWQLREIDGEQTINDHSDPEYDAWVIKRIKTDVHRVITPIIKAVAKSEERLIRYNARLENALRKIDEADLEMVAHPMKESYHTVWFELYEELIRLSGRTRSE
ncbi:hypothetical protein [Roseobacter weihaiensis]|uniref:hypothetical protein n=1 Tax=Roseobacter weihaiensis TaxID=2763262 RepID=UPI001D0ACBBA|nr:hypothetical protein [Roseobacter sp. H9]